LPVVLDVVVRHRKRACAGHVDGAAVDHRGGPLPAEAAAFEQFDLAAAAFLGWRADHRQREAGAVDGGC